MAQAVGGALVVTVIILFGILLSSFWTGRAIASLSASNAAAVTINGHQFWWEVQYEDATPSRRVTTANELHVPVGRPVKLQLGSRDVIHSFWVPMLHGKRDLLPDRTTTLWIQADQAGEFQGQCAEFCGRQHAHMAIRVVAQTDADFNRWLDAQRAAAAEPATEQARHGRDVFLTSRCSACHAILGTPANGLIGPDLTHFASRPTIGAGTLPMTRDALARWIANPQLRQAWQPDAAESAVRLGSRRLGGLSGGIEMIAGQARAPGGRSAAARRDVERPTGVARLAHGRRSQGDRPALPGHRVRVLPAGRRAGRVDAHSAGPSREHVHRARSVRPAVHDARHHHDVPVRRARSCRGSASTSCR